MTATTLEPILDLADIQGNILRGYRFPLVRHLFFQLNGATAAQTFVRTLLPAVTTAAHWGPGKIPATLNIACTYGGLVALGVPLASLETFPPEFREGMAARAATYLADWGPSAPERWERIWRDGRVHLLVTVHTLTDAVMHERCQWVLHEAARGEHSLLGTQDCAPLTPTGQEHFGYADGLANPAIAGSGQKMEPGEGKLMPDGTWAPIAAGEFLLGHRDEAGEMPVAPEPRLLARNSTFLVYRKLHQNVATFRRYLQEQGAHYAGGPEMLAAKLMGRWRDATPLELSPDGPEPGIVADEARVNAFGFGGDPEGARCPRGAHIRRSNPRDALGYTALVNRRRLIRRGVPYGKWTPLSEPGDDTGEHGIVFIALNASTSRQFEFVQREWLNYGNDFRLGNTTDPIVAYHDGTDRSVIPGSTAPMRPTYVCTGLPLFVEVRGGDYFFVPSLTALQLLARGAVEFS